MNALITASSRAKADDTSCIDVTHKCSSVNPSNCHVKGIVLKGHIVKDKISIKLSVPPVLVVEGLVENNLRTTGFVVWVVVLHVRAAYTV